MSPRTRPAGEWAETANYIDKPGKHIPTSGRSVGPWVRFTNVPSARGPVTVDIAVGLDDTGRLTTYGILTSAGISQPVLDSLPLNALRRSAAAFLYESANGRGARTALGMKPLRFDLVQLRDDPGSPEFLQAIADVCANAKAQGLSAITAVMGAADVAESQAKRYIAAARAAGLVPEYRRKGDSGR